MKKTNLFAILLTLAMLCTMLPTQAFAASTPKISPSGTKYVYAGTSITIKPSGTYKKVAYKSNNTKAATVSKKGVVKAVKKGTAKITATFTLKNKKTVAKTCTIKVLSSNIIKLTEVNDTSAQEVVKALEKGKAYDILVKGNKTSTVETIESLKKKIGYVNEYSVLFQYNDISSCNEGYLFHVTADNCEMYNLSLSFFKKIVAQAEKVIHGFEYSDGRQDILGFARTFDSWEAFVDIAVEEFGFTGTEEDQRADARRVWMYANHKFCDLSQAMQVWIISWSGYFSGNGNFLHQFGEMGIVYGSKDRNLWGKSALQQMRVMENDTAKDVCSGIAKAEVTALTQIGIECLYEQDPGHAWTMVYPYNSDGQRLTYVFNYGIEGLENATPGADPSIKTVSNRLAICSSKSLIY